MGNIRIEALPNGLLNVWHYGTGTSTTFDRRGNYRFGFMHEGTRHYELMRAAVLAFIRS